MPQYSGHITTPCGSTPSSPDTQSISCAPIAPTVNRSLHKDQLITDSLLHRTPLSSPSVGPPNWSQLNDSLSPSGIPTTNTLATFLEKCASTLEPGPPEPELTLRHGDVTINVVSREHFEQADTSAYFATYVYPRPDKDTTYINVVKDTRFTSNPSPTPTATAEPDWSKLPAEYQEYKAAFKATTTTLPQHGPHDLKIDLEDGKTPPFGPLYNLSEVELKLVHDYIEDMMSRELIRPSTASCGAPILFARKKDGSLRLCVDYRRLNNMTKKNVYPLPLISELIDKVGKSKIFSKFDMKDAYWACAHCQR